MPALAKTLPTLVACAALILGCQSAHARKPPDELEQALQSVLDDVVATNDTIPGVALHVEMPRAGLSWSGAAGVADRASGVPLTPQHPVRIASNTKTFVAAAMLRLWEEGRLDLDSSIAAHLPSDFVQTMKGDGYQPEAITVRHLLTHTSGLFDYADSEEFLEQYEANVTRRWTRAEQLQGAMDWGDPYGAPGEVYRYSDTGYILLGEILEGLTGQPMGTALRELIGYEALGLTSTWLETLEPKPAAVPDRAHQYEGDFDTYALDPSLDLYGGGGLASTVGDLARFMRGVFTGRVYVGSTTRDTMLSTVLATEAGPPAYGVTQVPGTYRMGVAVDEIDGVTVYVHTGYWGTLAAYVPSLDLAVGATVTQQQARALFPLLRRVLELVRTATVAVNRQPNKGVAPDGRWFDAQRPQVNANALDGETSRPISAV